MKEHRFEQTCRVIFACLALSWLAAPPPCRGEDSGFDVIRKAAEQGDAQAARRLATAYDTGMGVAHDDAEAARWYDQAARLGDPDAQFRLGVLYREGRGVMKDPKRAYAWFHLAASNPTFLDNDDAATYRDEAAKGLDASQLDQARELARAWAPTPKGAGPTAAPPAR